MTHLTPQKMTARLLEVAQETPEIMALVDYGSSVEGRADEWSDVDVALFIADEALAEFDANWQRWAAQFGKLLLAYKGGIGHPWCVYESEPIPLRVDFEFIPVSDLAQIRTWPKSPTAVETMVLYDQTGKLADLVAPMVGQSLGPEDPQAAFTAICGDFWYYALRTYGKIQRQQEWLARWEFNFIMLGNLTALMRLESGQTERFRASHAIDGIETAVSAERLTQLNHCIPGKGLDEIQRVLAASVQLGFDVCARIHAEHGWPWPQPLAEQVKEIMA